MAAGRFLSPQLRQRSVTAVRFLLAAPYLLFVLPLSMPVAVGAVALASTGFASTLLLQERLIALTGEDIRGQALCLHATGMKAMQAVGATLAGLAAQYLPVGTAMTALAVASLAVTVALSPGLRLSVPTSPVHADPATECHVGSTRWYTGRNTKRDRQGRAPVRNGSVRHQRKTSVAFYGRVRHQWAG